MIIIRNRIFKTDERISEVYNRIGTICFHILSVLVWLNLIYRIVVLKQEWREFTDIVVVLVFVAVFYIVIISYFIREAVISASKERPSGPSIVALVTGILGVSLGMLYISMPPDVFYILNSISSRIINFITVVVVGSLLITSIVCGGIDLKRIKAGRNSKKGRGFDIAGIVLGGVPILFALGLLVFLFPTLFGVHNGSPAWSPDGKKIAFISFHNRRQEIYVMNTDGSDWKRLTGAE